MITFEAPLFRTYPRVEDQHIANHAPAPQRLAVSPSATFGHVNSLREWTHDAAQRRRGGARNEFVSLIALTFLGRHFVRPHSRKPRMVRARNLVQGIMDVK